MNTIIVPCTTLDAFVELNVTNFGQTLCGPSVVKIDVEGFELNVLKGGAGYIRQYSPILAFEWDGRDVDNALCLYEIRNIVGGDYRFFQLDTPRPKWATHYLLYFAFRLIFGYGGLREIHIFECAYYSAVIATPRKYASLLEGCNVIQA